MHGDLQDLNWTIDGKKQEIKNLKAHRPPRWTTQVAKEEKQIHHLLDEWDALERKTKVVLHNMAAYIASVGVAMLDDTAVNAPGRGQMLYNTAKDWSQKKLDTLQTMWQRPSPT